MAVEAEEKVKNGFFKRKTYRLWSQTFEDTKPLFEIFKRNFDFAKQREINWETENYVDLIKGRIRVPAHPETDVYDDSEGITPKQIKAFLEISSLEALEMFLNALSVKSQELSNLRDEDNDYLFDGETNTICWKDIMKLRFMPYIKQGNLSELGKFIFDAHFSNFPYRINNEVYAGLLTGEISVEDLKFLQQEKPVPLNTEITPDLTSLDKFFKKRESIWQEMHNFIPKSKEVLMINPEFWDKDIFLDSMETLYGVKQISKISETDQKEFLKFYQAFGKNLKLVAHQIKQEKRRAINSDWIYLYEEFKNHSKQLQTIIEAARRGIDPQFTAEDFYHFLLALQFIEGTADKIEKKDRITVKDIQSLKQAGGFVLRMMKVGKFESFKAIPYEHIEMFEKIRMSEEQIRLTLELFGKTKDKKVKRIPLHSGEYDGYTYEAIPKSDIRGLICGIATGCCQHVTGVGKQCTYFGAEEEDSCFFIVSKNGTIVAQSWIWTNGSQMTFDSIEAVTNGNGREIIECYKEYSKYVLKETKEFDTITVGSYGRTGQNCFERANDFKQVPKSIYTDARTQYLIAKR